MPIGLLNNDFIKDLRKDLLLRNLNPTTEAIAGGVGDLNVNRGLPAETSLSQGEYIPLNQTNVSSFGHYQLKLLSLKNVYAPTEFNQIELTDISSIAGNIGTYPDYVRTNTTQSFDLKQFVLGTPSLVNYTDTPLGIIGAEQLKFSLESNIAANTSKNTLGRVNLNLFSLLNGEEFLIRNYQITEVPNTPLGFFVNLAQKYSGFEIPKSYIPKGAFGFLDSLFDGKMIYGDCNLEGADITIKDEDRMDGKMRNDLLLRYTGRGNRVQLFNLLGINKYRPNYDDPNGPNTGLNRIFGFLQQRKNNAEAGYTTLDKTRRHTGVLPVMGKQGNAQPIGTTNFGDNKLTVIDKSKEGETGAFLENDARSVLGTNGLPKITWTNKNTPDQYKRFMFSIENLAWMGYTDGLPECEIGNGDLNSDDNRPGRIMWFPPYDLTFDESVTVNWDRNNFIGRGEQIFTYNNTTRSGTIKFKIVVDHPSILNQLRNKFANDEILKFFKGCDDYVKKGLEKLEEISSSGMMKKDYIDTLEEKLIQVEEKKSNIKYTDITKPGETSNFKVKMYFDNNDASLLVTYENPGLNSQGDGYLSNNTISNIDKVVYDKNIEKVDATISVSCSSRGTQQENDVLYGTRFDAASNWIKANLSAAFAESKQNFNFIKGANVTVPDTTTNDPNDPKEKNARFALIDITVKLKDLKSTSATTEETITFSDKTIQDRVTNEVTKVLTSVYSECNYFEFLENNVPFVFKSLKEKLKYFHPGFHSTTPEGFNSRLTFLHQCTRQGPSISENPEGGKNNLAFGRPPILILRIGDFFHTKMVIENMSIQYDEGVLWDLNPEGIGVQPRLASVNLGVSYIGGQSLMTPIRELQNALGYKFYANTETFQHEPIFVVNSVTRMNTQPNECEDLCNGLTPKDVAVTPTIDQLNNKVPVSLTEVTSQLIPLNQQPLTSSNSFFESATNSLNTSNSFINNFSGGFTNK